MSDTEHDPMNTLEQGHSQRSRDHNKEPANILAKHFSEHDFHEHAKTGDIRETANGRFMFNGVNWVHESHWQSMLYQEMAKVANVTVEEQLHLDLDPDICAQPTQERTAKHTNTPSYYTASQHDLYSLFIQHYGLEVWQQHVEMEVIQYLWRCRSKGTYLQDITKAKVILERILKETQQQSQSSSQEPES